MFRESSLKDTNEKALADDFFVGILCAQTRDDDAAIAALELVVNSPQTLPDKLMAKYVSSGEVAIPVTAHVAIDVPLGSLCAALTLTEVYQGNDRVEEAIGLLQQLVELAPHPYLVLSLCDLYAATEAWDELVDVALQAAAFEAQGMNQAALEAHKDALRSKKRDPALLREARYQRGRLYITMGRKAQGRKELEKVYAEDPGYRDVRDLIAAVRG